MTKTFTCETCKFSRTQEIYDPIVDSMKYKFNSVPGIDVEKLIRYNITICPLQGPPKKVKSNDWCYKWEEKATSNFGEIK
jgi:hypothetical protein